MKKKNLIISTAILAGGLVLATVPTSIALIRASSSPKELSGDITPTSPGRGETVSFLPDAVSKYWQMEDLLNTYASKASEIGELTPYSAEQQTWTTLSFDKQREMFNKYDIYRPTNNVLGWESKIDAKEYRVIISQDKAFTNIEREYTVAGTEKSVTFVNPYTGTDYYWQVIATKQDDSKVYSDIFNFTVANLPRTVTIDGVSNTRDLGGNVGLSGKKMKEGLIYRGSRLEAYSTGGKTEAVNNLGFKTELDLRNDGEGTKNVLGLANYYNCPSPYVIGNGVAAPEALDYFGSGSLVTSFGNAIKVLANKDNYPVYFHCAVGRDRTGWMGICLDFLCGVSEEIALKEFCLSLFSTSGAYTKANVDFYNRFKSISNYIKAYEGDTLSEKTEDYLVKHAGVTHDDCENVRKILLGEISTGYVPGKANPDPYTNLVKVTFRQYGKTPIIKMVETGSKLEKPSVSIKGDWYHGNDIWDFDNDIVTEDTYLDFIGSDKCKVAVQYSGIELPNDVFDVAYHTELDYTMFNRQGYTFKVYDDQFNLLPTCMVETDLTLNVVYRSISGYVPKSNSRIIVTAGQSNAAGVGHYPYLVQSLDEAKIAEINHGYDNVLITGYTHDIYWDGWRTVQVDENSNTVQQKGTFGYELSLAERFSKAFPDETTYIVKYAFGGAYLNSDWISPSGKVIPQYAATVFDRERGWMYNGLVEILKGAIESIETMTNTIPMIEGLMWMQGESDATTDQLANAYLTSFNYLVSDFTKEFKDNISYKFAVYDAAIAETELWMYAEQINAMKRSRVDDRNLYIETNNILTTRFEPVGSADNAHYDAACYIQLGHMFADACLARNNKNYKANVITMTGPESVTIKIGDDPLTITPKAFFNGIEVAAKFSFYSRNVKMFKVDKDNKLVGLFPGSTELRMTAYYQDEVCTMIIPAEVIE